MNSLAVALIYLAMLMFDASVLASAGYVIIEKGWSAWCVLVAVFICYGSNPSKFLETISAANNKRRSDE